MERPEYNAEIFNQPERYFIDAAQQLGTAKEDFKRYRDMMETDHSGLLGYVRAWVGAIRRDYGSRYPASLIAESGFNNGVLTTYGILRTVAGQTGVDIKDVNFDPDYLVDADPVEVKKRSEEKTLLDRSDRGTVLPERFPCIYEAGIIAISSIAKQPPEKIKDTINKPGIRPDSDRLIIVNHLMGIAETVLPLERSAEMARLEKDFNA